MSQRLGRIENEVAIITASGSGMGRAGARLFASEGAKVIVADFSEKNGNETVDMIKQAGGEAAFFKVDVSKLDQIKAAVDFAAQKYGGLDIVWNHAGIPGPAGIDVSSEDFDMTVAINLKSCYFITQYAFPYLKESKNSPAILFTSSTSGVCGSPNAPVYGMAKGGVVNLTRSLAGNLAKFNIRVNCILPGPTDTPMWLVFSGRPGQDSAEQREAYTKAFTQTIPMKRLQRPEELASPALALVEPASSFVTGAILPSDGGFTAV